MKYLIVVAALLHPTTANAHYLWIEQPAEVSAVVRFGEYNDGQIERSPGRMDEMPSVEAFAGRNPLPVVKAPDGFLLSVKAGSEGLTAIEDDYAVKDWRANGIGIAKPMYYARFGHASAPSLDLDIVTAPADSAVQVFLHGRPLPSAQVDVHAPNGWSRSLRADREGRLTISTPWRGQYVLEVVHAEAASGTYNGTAYDVIRHRTTLTLVKDTGSATFAIPRVDSHPH